MKRLAPWMVWMWFAVVNLSAQNLTLLHTFSATSGITNWDGAEPKADLVLSGNTLYGTAPLGGTNGYGTVFAVNTDGTGFTVLHTFTGGSDGGVPQKNLVLSGGTLYGLVERGTNLVGYGSVFSISTNGGNFNVLYTFATNTSGALGEPNPGLILSGNTFYGVAYQGGISNAGSIFSLDTNGTFQLLHLFNTGTDGKNPLGSLVLSGDTLYGTARNGGTNGVGTVFSINTNGNNFTVLHTFSNAPSLDGRYPDAGLVVSGSTLYGTTSFGGTNNGGTVFAINTDDSGYAVLHSFNPDVGEGKIPEASLVQWGNTLYGTTLGNGTSLNGTVFSVNTDGGSFTMLHTFSPTNSINGYTNTDGAQPYAALAMAGNVLYGTATLGGSAGNGVVFSLAVVPQITGLTIAGTNLVLNGINGLAGTTCTLLTA
ncbi:MAG TPA: choice-of-anchor tandem repeat GloVer-containing protein, partial [Candidatus Nitrosopolaris sp.]|nr:choice-of-anchor tandem repeat GloVer-containing protein [Candidatus Nitrosopolaris sp.]